MLSVSDFTSMEVKFDEKARYEERGHCDGCSARRVGRRNHRTLALDIIY